MPSIGASSSSAVAVGRDGDAALVGSPSRRVPWPVSGAPRRPSSCVHVGVLAREGRRGEVAGQARAAPPPPAIERGVVHRPVVAAANEDRGAGGRHLLAIGDVDERQRPGEVDRGAEVDRQVRRAQRTVRSRPLLAAGAARRPRARTGSGRWRDRSRVSARSGGRSAAGRGLGQVATGPVAADLADVLLVLEDDAERLVDELRRQLARPERQERRRPVERLGDARAPWSGRPRAVDGRNRRPRARGAPGASGTGPGRSRIPSARSGSRSSGTGSGA